MKIQRGSELSIEEQQKALLRFVHRYTKDHLPSWAQGSWKPGKAYPVQFASDKDWLEHTEFYVTNDGRLSERHNHCMSYPTWPDGKESPSMVNTK